MQLKGRGSSLISNALSMSALAAATAGVCLLAGTIYTFHQLTLGPPIQVDVPQLIWWKDVHFKAKSRDFSQRIPSVAVTVNPTFHATLPTVTTAAAPLRSTRDAIVDQEPEANSVESAMARQRRLATHKVPGIRKKASVKARGTYGSTAKSTVTQVSNSSSLKAAVKSAPVVQKLSLEAQADPAELSAMRSVYGSLRGQFRFAINDKAVPTQLAQRMPDQMDGSSSSHGISNPKVNTQNARPKRTLAKRVENPRRKLNAPPESPPEIRNHLSVQATPVADLERKPTQGSKASEILVASVSLGPKTRGLPAAYDFTNAPSLNSVPSESLDTQRITETPIFPETTQPRTLPPEQSHLTPDRQGAAATTVKVDSHKQTKNSASVPVTVVTTQLATPRLTRTQHVQKGYEYSTLPTPSKTRARTKTNTPTSVTTQKSSQATDHTAMTIAGPVRSEQKDLSLTVDQSQLKSLNSIEAFEWRTQLPFSRSQVFSDEGAHDSRKSKWYRTTADSYWPTLSWSVLSAQGTPTPLLSQNTARLLATLSGVRLQPHAGIVFGRIAKGWGVEFSGRSEKILVLDENNQLIPAEDLSRDRYFAFVNAAPGAHLLYALAPDGSRKSALLAPVVENTATYLDLSQTRVVHVSGKVFDGASSTAKPLVGVQVRILGQSSQTAMTDRYGNFRIPEVTTLGASHPLFVETTPREGFTHRYKIASDTKVISLSLFIFTPKQVALWTNQLEGGVSDQSGLILGVVGEAGSRFDEIPLMPKVAPVSPATLAPETYSLAINDQLQVQTPLEPSAPRFISVQVPEGLNLASAENPNEQVLWSELVVASPGVISVVGLH